MATRSTLSDFEPIETEPVLLIRQPLLPPEPSIGYDEPGRIDGTSGADVLIGSNEHDSIYGYGGDDMLFGNGGGDGLHGGWGADFLDGGDGGDLASYSDSPDGVTVDLTLGRGFWGTAEGDRLVNIENLGGSNYNDVLIGNDVANDIGARAGDDRLMGGGGADALHGGEGRDTADYSDSAAGVTVNLANGTGFGGSAEGDTLDGIEDLLGSSQNDSLLGNDGSNYLYGAGGDDLIKGAGGADTLEGVGGNDTLKGGGGADTLIGGTGINTASYLGSPASVFVSVNDHVAAYGDAEGDMLYNIDNLTGSIYADDLWGDGWANVLNGGDGNDKLKGFGGADTLLGGSGNDRLEGMTGVDVMAGGAGADTFAWNSTAETGVTISTMDLITDFNIAEGDRINLGAVDANVFASGNQTFTFIGQAAFTGTPGEVNFIHVGNETIIQMQTGTGADIEGGIRLAGIHTPDASWFVL
jgi:Ca2+-binding RTX toxin-like protein